MRLPSPTRTYTMGSIYIWITTAILFGICGSLLYVSIARPKPSCRRYIIAAGAYTMLGLCIAAALYIVFN
ncbi:MAG: hypothetical protein K2M76_05215 [Muribaculaceae bacterium]|nr:hypothetical protein [Muribaculaceae bacterium]